MAMDGFSFLLSSHLSEDGERKSKLLTLAKGREGVNAAGLTRGGKAVILRNLHVVFGEPSDAGGHCLSIHRFGLCLHLAGTKKSRDHAAVFGLAADCSALVSLPHLDFDRCCLRYVV